MAEESIKYSAFISYKHGELDSYVAENLHKSIETFHIPKQIQKQTGKKKVDRVFRDKDELPISSNLADNISMALQNSEYLIVVCSPRTPESYWVQKEIETFIQIHDRDHVLAVLIEGEPDEAFPEQLRFAEQIRELPDGTRQVERIPVEPLAADLRAADRKELNKKLKTEILRIMAPLLGCRYDDLRQRDRERKMRRAIRFSIGLAAVFLAFGLYSLYNTMQINRQYRIKQENQSRYLAETSQRLLGEGDRELAIKIALEALPESEESDDRPYVPEAEYALSDALHTYANGNDFVAVSQLSCDGKVEEIITSSDAMMIVARDSMQQIYVWDAATLEPVIKLEAEYDEEYNMDERLSLAFNNNNQLIYGMYDGLVCWDCIQDREVWRQEWDGLVLDSLLTRQKDKIAVITVDECILLDAQTGDIIAETEEYQMRSNMAFSPDGTCLVFGVNTESGVSCMVWDLQNNSVTEFQNPEWNDHFLTDIKFAGNDQVIVAALLNDYAPTLDGNLTMFRSDTLEQVWTQDYALTEMDVYYLVDDTDYQEPILLSNSGSALRRIHVDTGEVEEISLSMSAAYARPISESMVLLISTEGEMAVLDMDTSLYMSMGEVAGTKSIIDCQSCGDYLFVQYYNDDKITVSEQKTGDSFQSCQLDLNVTEAVFAPDHQSIVALTDDGLAVIDVETYEVIQEFPEVLSYSVCPAGNALIYIGEDGILHRWSFSTRQEEESAPMLEEDFYAYYKYKGTFSDNGEYFACANADELKIVHTLEMSRSQVIKGDSLKTLVITSDGSYVAARGYDGRLAVFDVNAGKKIEMSEQGYGVCDAIDPSVTLAVANQHPWAAVWGTDNFIHLIDLSNGQEFTKFEMKAGDYMLEFSEDDSVLMASGLESSITIFDIEAQEIVKKIAVDHASFESVLYEPERELYIWKNIYGAYLITTKNDEYSVIAYVPSFQCMDSVTGNIYINGRRNGFGYFTYQNLDNLIEQGKELVDQEELTDLEKRIYHVE